MSPFRITVLADDTVAARTARGEHGLCFHIAIHDRNILFDTGQGLVLADNSQALGIDLGNVDTLAHELGHRPLAPHRAAASCAHALHRPGSDRRAMDRLPRRMPARRCRGHLRILNYKGKTT